MSDHDALASKDFDKTSLKSVKKPVFELEVQIAQFLESQAGAYMLEKAYKSFIEKLRLMKNIVENILESPEDFERAAFSNRLIEYQQEGGRQFRNEIYGQKIGRTITRC